MKRRCAVVPVVALTLVLLITAAVPCAATTSTGDAGANMLFLGCAAVTWLNVMHATIGTGSTAFGIAGIAFGATLTTYSFISDDMEGDEGFYAAAGVLTAAIGALDIWRARSRRDTDLLGMRVDPMVGAIDGRLRFGAQLTARW
jgi:hypothetical protein